MPCFDAAPYLKEAVESAQYQSYGNMELSMVDDGSTDASPRISSGLVTQ
jgi:glycosyltransferase involved in cell wall biosynthesis